MGLIIGFHLLHAKINVKMVMNTRRDESP